MLLSRFVEAVVGKVDTVENGVELINRIQKSPTAFDIIVTDVQMPLVNGFEATRESEKVNLNSDYRSNRRCLSDDTRKSNLGRCDGCRYQANQSTTVS